MIDLKTASPSSISKFTQCQRQWALNYDQDAKIRTSSVAAERGTLVHAALECWRDPSHAHCKTLEALEGCFAHACATAGIGESLEVFTTGKAILAKAFEFIANHPVMPLERTHVWMVEAKIDRWLPSSDHALPILGFIDTIELVFSATDPKSVILVVGDYKTGKSKSKEELLEDIQPPIYMAYALYVLKPYLESQDFIVTNVLNVWTYIAEGECVILTQDDYDLPVVMEYVASISRQMVAAATEYNSKTGDDRDAWLHRREKLNVFCNWCPVRGSCSQLERAFEQKAMIDMMAPGMTLDVILAERDRYALTHRESEERRRDIDRMVRHHMEINGLTQIEANEKVYYEVVNRDKVIDPKAIAHVFGVDFFVANGRVTQDAIKNQINVLKITQPDSVQGVVDFLEEHTSEELGARYIRSKKAPKPKETKARGKKSV